MSFHRVLARIITVAWVVVPSIASAQTSAPQRTSGITAATTPVEAQITAARTAQPTTFSPSGPRRPYRFVPEIDIPLLLFGATAWPITELALRDEVPAYQCPCDSSSLNSIDRGAVGLNASTSAITQPLSYAIFGLVAVGDALDVGLSRRPWYEFFEDAAIVVEAVSLASAANGLLQVAIARPRPSVYDVVPGSSGSGAISNPDSYSSFPSSTATYAFVATAAGAMTYTLRHPKSPWRFVYWGGGMAVSATAGILRVVAGRHFPTDVLMSAALGSLIGVVVPWLHARHVPAMVGGTVFEGGALATVTMAAP